MKLVIDTNAYSSANRGDSSIVKFFNSSNTLLVPTIVLGELRAGFEHGSRSAINHRELNVFLLQPNTDILHVTEKTTVHYGEIFASLRKFGRPINTNDIWIAAICIENNLPLLTLDSDFQHIKGLRLAL